MADRFCVQHRLFKSLRRADVGLRRAGLDGDAVADAGIFHHRTRHDLALLEIGVELVDAERGEVAGRAGHDLLVQRRPGLEAHIDLMAGGLLKAGRQLAHAGRGCLVEIDGDFSCAGTPHRRENADRGRKREHPPPGHSCDRSCHVTLRLVRSPVGWVERAAKPIAVIVVIAVIDTGLVHDGFRQAAQPILRPQLPATAWPAPPASCAAMAPPPAMP